MSDSPLYNLTCASRVLDRSLQWTIAADFVTGDITNNMWQLWSLRSLEFISKKVSKFERITLRIAVDVSSLEKLSLLLHSSLH